MAHAIADDDIVRTLEEAEGNERVPLLVLDPLLAYLDEQGLGSGEPEISPIGDGHSNVTYLVRRGDTAFVLRRPPRPPIPPSANDMVREARVQRALAGYARVPEILAVCEDTSILGVPFYVMELLEGHVLNDATPPELDSPEDRHRAGMDLVETLVELHAVDWRAVGLEGFGKPEGYLGRQVRRFGGLWEHNKTREVPSVERVQGWLARTAPPSPPASVVHGDFRIGNVMYALESPARVSGIFDWEMSTIGDPLADLGYMSMFWSQPSDPPLKMFQLSPVTRQEGFATREELVAHYGRLTGLDVSDIRWYQTLAVWKAVIFMEGNFRRASTGLSDDPYLASFGDGVVELAEYAEGLTEQA
jgi:aminoglycoside phosphotransferase (APT) family kinase protein